MSELLLDPEIRTWVFMPIVFITFLVGIIQRYASLLVAPNQRPELNQLQDCHAVQRARLLREHGHLLTSPAFRMRQLYFNDPDTGYFHSELRPRQPTIKPAIMMNDLLRGALTNVLPMMFLGGCINSLFSGFVTTRVPFPLTFDFKSMLQQGVYLEALDASWVSSMSWYFLNVFGLRTITSLLEPEQSEAEQTQGKNDAILNATLSVLRDPKAVFKAECEALELFEDGHVWPEMEEDAEFDEPNVNENESDFEDENEDAVEDAVEDDETI